MTGAQDLTATIDLKEGEPFTLVARPTTANGTLVTAALINADSGRAWTYAVYDKDSTTPNTAVFTAVGARGSVMQTVPVKDGYWPRADSGYTFIYPLPVIQARGTVQILTTATVPDVADGDTLTIGDGTDSQTFEWDDDASVTAGNIAVTIAASAAGCSANLTAAINAASTGLDVRAVGYDTTTEANDVVIVEHLQWGTIGNVQMLQSGATMALVGMSGGDGYRMEGGHTYKHVHTLDGNYNDTATNWGPIHIVAFTRIRTVDPS